jgi:hypothetical protein
MILCLTVIEWATSAALIAVVFFVLGMWVFHESEV